MRSNVFRPRWTKLMAAMLPAALLATTVSTVHTSPAAAAPPRLISPAPASSALTIDQSIAEARRTGKAVEATGANTATSTLTASPDGILTLKQTAFPTRKRVNGAWVDLDATLRRNGDGSVSPAVSTNDLRLSAGGNGPLATMAHGGNAFAMTLPVALPAPSLTGDTATYANVLPGVDLLVTADVEGGFSHVFVVRDATAAGNPALKKLTFATRTPGLTLKGDAAGNISGSDRLGNVVLTAPTPAMWDSAVATPQTATARVAGVESSTPRGPGSGANTVSIPTTVSSATIELTPNPTFLADPKTVYPVYIDPTYNWSSYGASNNGWATISPDHATTNYWKNTPSPEGFMQVGNVGEIRAWTLVNFPINSALLKTAAISSASFDITEIWSYSCSPRVVNVYTPGTTLTSSNAIWNSWKNVDLGPVVDSQNVAHGYNSRCPAKGVGFDVTSSIKTIVEANKKTQTFLLAAGTAEYEGWKKFDKRTPSLTVKYNHRPNTPTGMSTSPTTTCAAPTPSAVGDGPVSLYAPVSDPNGGVLGVSFKLWKTSDTTETPVKSSDPNLLTYSSGSTAVLVVPAATLKGASGAAATQFSWRVQATDFNLASYWSATCSFTFDPTRTGPPVVTPPSGDTTIGTAATFTIAPPASGTVPTSYSYQLNAAPPATVSATGGAASISINPTRATNTLAVTSLSAGGNFGQTASVTFNSTPAATAADGDLTGDNVSDLLAVGAANGLPAGVWVAGGRGASGLNPNAVNIGANGNGLTGNNKPADFTGATIITGHFHGTGLQDVLAYYPSGPNAGGGVILHGNGDGSVLHTDSDNRTAISAGVLSDAGGANPLQLANAGDTTHRGLNYPDLIGISGDTTNGFSLTYYPNNDFVGGWAQVDQLTSVLTPTGGTDWNNWTITTAQTANGTAMFLRNARTGVLHLWTNLAYDIDSQTLTYTPYTLASNWNTNTALQLRAGDINGDGTADLWTVGAAATVTPWLVSNLAGGSGTIAKQPAQALVTATYSWPLNGPIDGPVVATDTTGGKVLTATGNAVWRTGDLFSPSVMLNTDPTGTLSDRSSGANLTHDAALIDTTRSFSVSVWVKPTDAGGVIVSEDGAHSSRFILWNEQADNTWRFGMATGDTTAWSYDQVITPTGAQLGVWTHLTATYNAATNTMALYVDG
ncbi:LamG-like jellyroll fold domain-containing protein, partial [Micromonospora zhanjiangensis]